METVSRPWGSYTTLAESDMFKVKKIIVKPNQRLSYQYHLQRAEVWTIIQGNALITLEGKDIEKTAGQVIEIPLQAKHRIKNNGADDLIFIEVQHGLYFGEEDIVRIEDDYMRN
jgi:mannose-6-phosphate isomerase